MSVQQALAQYFKGEVAAIKQSGKLLPINKIEQQKSRKTIYQHKGWNTQFVATTYYQFDLSKAVNEVIAQQGAAVREARLDGLLDFWGWEEIDKPLLKKYNLKLGEELWTTLKYIPAKITLMDIWMWSKWGNDVVTADEVQSIVNTVKGLSDEEVSLLQVLLENNLTQQNTTIADLKESCTHIDCNTVVKSLANKQIIAHNGDWLAVV